MGSTTPEAIAEQLQQSSEWNAIAEAVFVCPMEPKHIAGVCEVERCSFPVPWTERMFTDEWNNPLSRYVVLLDRQNPSTVIAYAGYWKIFDEGHITNVAGHPDWRGRKAATYLLLQMMHLAQAEGIKDMTLEVRKSNVAAQGLYQKLGFAIEGERKKYYEDNNEDAWIMWYRAEKKEEDSNANG